MKRITFLIIAIFLSACASSTSLYKFDYPLTNETAQSQYLDISVKIPQDWFTVEDNECNCIDLLLVNKEQTESIKFVPINIDSTAQEKNELLGMKEILNISKKFRQAALGNKFRQINDDEFFEINSNKFAAYRYLNGKGKIKRVVVFSSNKKYFESIADPETDEANSPENLRELYRIQNSLLTSVK